MGTLLSTSPCGVIPIWPSSESKRRVASPVHRARPQADALPGGCEQGEPRGWCPLHRGSLSHLLRLSVGAQTWSERAPNGRRFETVLFQFRQRD